MNRRDREIVAGGLVKVAKDLIGAFFVGDLFTSVKGNDIKRLNNVVRKGYAVPTWGVFSNKPNSFDIRQIKNTYGVDSVKIFNLKESGLYVVLIDENNVKGSHYGRKGFIRG